MAYSKGYWIEEIRRNDEGMMTIILSCEKHCACMEIYGTKEKATQRMLVVLTALNKQEE